MKRPRRLLVWVMAASLLAAGVAAAAVLSLGISDRSLVPPPQWPYDGGWVTRAHVRVTVIRHGASDLPGTAPVEPAELSTDTVTVLPPGCSISVVLSLIHI